MDLARIYENDATKRDDLTRRVVFYLEDGEKIATKTLSTKLANFTTAVERSDENVKEIGHMAEIGLDLAGDGH